MKFGFFDDANQEYVITTPKTPLPWINYLGSNEFFHLCLTPVADIHFTKMQKCYVLLVIAIMMFLVT